MIHEVCCCNCHKTTRDRLSQLAIASTLPPNQSNLQISSENAELLPEEETSLILSRIRSRNDHHDIVASIFIQIPIPYRWLQFMPIFIYPFLQIEWSWYSHCPIFYFKTKVIQFFLMLTRRDC